MANVSFGPTVPPPLAIEKSSKKREDIVYAIVYIDGTNIPLFSSKFMMRCAKEMGIKIELKKPFILTPLEMNTLAVKMIIHLLDAAWTDSYSENIQDLAHYCAAWKSVRLLQHLSKAKKDITFS
jgi:hypothetical protein